jgi:hypothetical protein
MIFSGGGHAPEMGGEGTGGIRLGDAWLNKPSITLLDRLASMVRH